MVLDCRIMFLGFINYLEKVPNLKSIVLIKVNNLFFKKILLYNLRLIYFIIFRPQKK